MIPEEPNYYLFSLPVLYVINIDDMPTIILIIPVNEMENESAFPLLSLFDPLFDILTVVDGL